MGGMSVLEVVGVIEAVVLAVAALFAWRTYHASVVDRIRAPRRRLLEDAIAELKKLAQTLEITDDRREIVAAQRRLSLALASLRWISVLSANEASYLEPDELDWHRMQDAMADLGYALRWLELDPRGMGEEPPGAYGDRPPLPSPPRTLRERWRRSRLRWRILAPARWTGARIRAVLGR
jgi:hypothetical protein